MSKYKETKRIDLLKALFALTRVASGDISGKAVQMVYDAKPMFYVDRGVDEGRFSKKGLDYISVDVLANATQINQGSRILVPCMKLTLEESAYFSDDSAQYKGSLSIIDRFFLDHNRIADFKALEDVSDDLKKNPIGAIEEARNKGKDLIVWSKQNKGLLELVVQVSDGDIQIGEIHLSYKPYQGGTILYAPTTPELQYVV